MSQIVEPRIDQAVLAYLSTANGRWRKVAMVFGRVSEALGAEFPEGEAGHELFDRHLAALVGAGRLQAQGDITRWRFSEVRLP
ncbi:MAG TPA: hypothetical protein VMB21_19195 [Candidatus Limnocylindria bacterium]|jgi:hypothetical protein|nr:hypothetical protein [Candidatus Limnocylindria bacterium]